MAILNRKLLPPGGQVPNFFVGGPDVAAARHAQVPGVHVQAGSQLPEVYSGGRRDCKVLLYKKDSGTGVSTKYTSL